ncbi:hypothetical protein CTAYLR_000977 [Chrysophaeum taylorii]|uniref:Tyrosinase copper-binding domain-containing protein n=1 Tax=Chrysophaeum taylorii TaxID=2483200 RepID=A0AAD7XJG3_9STRA|nr:hypothetical protein CTAYLR_000977 [Chrysophaeum taylorii]
MIFKVVAAFGVGASGCPSSRIRREIRSIEAETRERYFAAMGVMRRLSASEGRREYGPAFRTYLEILLKHFYAAADVRTDQGHFSAGFFVFHRSLVLEFENSVLAIDPKVGGLPYWDFDLDFEESPDDPSKSIVWSDDFFGPHHGDAENMFQIRSGPFADWKVPSGDWFQGPPRLDLNSGEIVHGVPSNPYGFLRGFANSNPAPGITRANQVCGEKSEVYAGIARDAVAGCLNRTSYMEFFKCIDFGTNGGDGPHPFAHSWVGGSWGANDGNCSKKQLDTGISDAINGCIACFKTNCTGLKLEDCVCEISHDACERADQPNATCQRFAGGDNGPGWLPTAPCKKCPECRRDSQMGAAGDFWDGLSSPNEPLFWSHHPNVDRIFMSWQLLVSGNESTPLPYSGFPPQGYGPGHNLHDVISSTYPFYATDLLIDHHHHFDDELTTKHPLTHADVLEMTRPTTASRGCAMGNALYAYDRAVGV